MTDSSNVAVPASDVAVDPANAAALPADPVPAIDSAMPLPEGTEKDKDESPLDVLDRILKEAQQKAGDKKASAEAAEKERIAKLMEEQKIEDQKHITEQLQAIENAKSSPEYQAQMEIQKEQQEKLAQEELARVGSDIRQLGHIKIDVQAEG